MKRNQDKQGKNIKVLISTEQVDRLELCEITSTEAYCIHLGKKRALFFGAIIFLPPFFAVIYFSAFLSDIFLFFGQMFPCY